MRKIIYFCCVMLLVLSVFAGCAKPVDNNTTGDNATSVQTELKFTYDAAYAVFDASTIDAYQKLCDAVINRKENVRMNLSMYDAVMRLYYTSFPLNVLVKDIRAADDQSGLVLSYLYEEELHFNMVKEFAEKIMTIQAECKKDATSKGAYIISVYHYVASHVSASESENISLFDTVMHNNGSSYSYAGLFEYLLLQEDIPAYHVIATDDRGTGWGMSQFEYNGSLYYADVMSEYCVNGGNLLQYFGMTTQELSNEGYTALQYSDQSTAAEASDLTFDFCRTSASWEMKDNKLLVTNFDGIVIELAL